MFGRLRKRDVTTDAAASAPATTPLAEENLRLRRAVEQLALLNDLAQAMGLSDSSNEMIQAIVHRAKQTLAAEQVMIYFVERSHDGDQFKTRARDATQQIRRSFHFDAAMLAMMEHRRTPFLSNDPRDEECLHGVELDEGLRSLLCVPLLVRGQLTGLIAACNKRTAAGFDDEDKRLLAIIANQSAQVLETTRLREEEAAFERLHRDVELAREIQTSLLPSQSPDIEGYDIAGCSVPAEIVGGDYFDFIALKDDRLGLCLGDVSGKGIPASLLMANLQATLRGQASLNTSASECVQWANRLLFRSTSPDKFATLFYAILDPRSHQLSYCNAGHERPLLVTCHGDRGCVEELAGGNLILGVVDEFAYTEGRIELEPGSLLLLYSDGLSDAIDPFDQPFGVERIKRTLESTSGLSASQINELLLGAVRQHVGRAPAFDDITMIAIRRLGRGDRGMNGTLP
jgi:phosphoserine phosphatase RsbU/P